MCIHSIGGNIVFALVKLRWKANMLTAAAVTEHGDGLRGELVVRCK
jgi:hypothetical protein